ncbi:UNVERIFIED_CONTAM: hypothetical protein Sangu_2443900 [Sesamum angustifolium]|uniref:Uncharacterized protein n=1 Tax=Sesamum angustifolium TaxID=2727405 RepID=A0AAW2KWZ3_9LAMI
MLLSCVSMPQTSSSTNKSAFEIVTGQQPLLPHTLNSPQGTRSPLARSFSQEWEQNIDIAKSCLEKAQKRMKKYANNNHRFVKFNAGDLVMVKVPDLRLSKSSRGRDSRLMQKYVGHLPIIKRIGTVRENFKGCPHSRHPCTRTQPLNSADQQPSPTDAGLPSLRVLGVGLFVLYILSSRLLRTANPPVPLPPHCGRHLVRPGEATSVVV